MEVYAIVVYMCMRDMPWRCSHERIEKVTSDKPLAEVCTGIAPNAIRRWQRRNEDWDVTGWDCVKQPP